MDDKDNSLYFSFDDESQGQAAAGGEAEAKAEEGSNRTFLIGAIALALVFVLGICAVVAYLFFFRGTPTPAGPSANELTNQFMETQAPTFLAQTAGALTQAAPPAEVATTEPAVEASVTPTSGLELTSISPTQSGTPGTQIAEVTTTTGTPGTPVPPGAGGLGVTGATSTPGGLGGAAKTPTATPTRGTSGIIEVTPLGGGGGGIIVITPTRIATGIGGPIQPTVPGSLPKTGVSGGLELGGAAALAVVLVVVVVVVRRIRMRP